MSITKAIKAGAVAKSRGGGVNPEHPLNAEYVRRHAGGGKSAVTTKQKPPRSPRGRQNVTLINADHVNVGTEGDPENKDAVEVSLQERIEKVRKLRLQNAILRGEYVLRSTLAQWIMRLYGVISSMFRNMGGRIMPELVAAIRSAESDDDAMRKGEAIIKNAVLEALTQTQKTILGFKGEVPELTVIDGNGNGDSHY